MQDSTLERIQLIHTYDTLPASTKRKLRVLRGLYLDPLQTCGQIKILLNSRDSASVVPVIQSLLNDGYISVAKKSIWVAQLQKWRVCVAYILAEKGKNLLIEQVKR